MKLIGSKTKLINFIQDSLLDVLKQNHDQRELSSLILADLFSGSGAIGLNFRDVFSKIIANDLQYYSYVCNSNILKSDIKNISFDNLINHYYLEIAKLKKDILPNSIDKNEEDKLKEKIDIVFSFLKDYAFSELEKLKTDNELLKNFNGFIFNNYCPNGNHNSEYKRSYFTDENGLIIDILRLKIDELFKQKHINEQEFYFLLSSLVDSADRVANTTGVYGAYLKNFKTNSLKTLSFTPSNYIINNKIRDNNEVFNLNCTDLIAHISGDVLYLDPPYNTRQYCDYYHLLETLSQYDFPEIKGKTGTRKDTSQKSKFSIKKEALSQLEYIIQQANFKYILLSYNDEGIISLKEIEDCFSKYGKYIQYKQNYKRYKSSNLDNQKTHVYEYLHCLILDNNK